MSWQVCMIPVLCLLLAFVINGRAKKRCLHDMEELTHVELKDEQGKTIGDGFILICKSVGKNGRTEELTRVELKDERGNTIGDGFILIV